MKSALHKGQILEKSHEPNFEMGSSRTGRSSMNSRIEHEIQHGRKLAAEGAEDVWNWTGPAGQVRAARRADYFISQAKIKAGDKILEIGCGTGLFTRKIYSATGATIVATDISEELLAEASAQLSAVTFQKEDAMNMSFEDNAFDVVFGSSVLHHLDMKKALEEIVRVLKPGGRMVFAEPNMINPQIFVQKNVPFIKKWLGDSPDETAINRWKFSRLMKQCGFRNILIFPYDFLHPVTPRPLIPLVNGIGKMLEKVPVVREIAGSVVIYGEKQEEAV